MLTCFISLRIAACIWYAGLGCKNCGEMSVTNTIFGRWELAAADDVYIRNGSGTNIGGQTFNMCRLTILISI